MGDATASRADSTSPVSFKAPSRFLINSLSVSIPSKLHPHSSSERHIIGPPNGPSLILPNHTPLLKSTIDSTSLSVSTQSLDPKKLVQYVQDPDPKSSGLLLKIPENAVLKFIVSIDTSAVSIENLTFIAAPSCSSLENLLVNEFLENPNIQNEENVVLLGDFTSASSSPTTFEFIWKTYPPLSSTLFKPDERGMKLVLCFAEYDKRDHSLKQLARFSVWLDHAQLPTVPPKVNTSLGTLPELSELSPIFSTSPSPVFRDIPSAPGYQFFFPNDINRIDNSRSGSPTVAKRNSVDNHSIPPPNFPAPPIPTSASPEDADSEPGVTTVSQPVTSMLILEKGAEAIEPREKKLPPPPPLHIQQQQQPIQPPLQSPAHASNIASVTIPRPQENSSSQPEDGPLFRATIASLEKKTGLLKIKVKKLLKRALMVHERQNSLIEAHALFLQSVQEMADSGFTSFQPLVSNFYNSKANGPYVELDLLRRSTADLSENVIIPLRKFYDQEIKSFDQRKKDFDDESREYYAWLSRYLSVKQEAKGKKKSESDSKYAERRKAFELRRFDYYSYFQDLHGGRKQQIVISKMALYAEQEMNRHIAIGERLKSGFKDNLLIFVNEIQDSSKEWNRQRTEREEHRRLIERPPTKDTHPDVTSPTNDKFLPNSASTSNTNIFIPPATNSNFNNINSALTASSADDYDHLITSPISISNAGIVHPLPLSLSNPMSSSVPETMRMHSPGVIVGSPEKTITAPTDLDGKSAESNRRKEGLLWAMSRPGGFNDQINLNKTGGWHKFWVVLAAGKLCEYTNWKQGVDLHNDPINLKVALVREARNAERRFCFEVVTPHYKRVYQATSEEDMQSWIRSINNGISSSLEGSSHSIKDYSASSDLPTIRPTHTNQSASHDSKLSPVSTSVIRLPDEPVDNNSLSDLKEEFAKLNSRKVSLHRRTSTQKNVTEKISPYKPSLSTKPTKTQPEKKGSTRISEVVYNLDASNRYCADCGSSSKVEWISINLLCILCIDCSGVHRSLGSHISKVRSLTLDTVSFTPEVIELIKSVNNSIINSIWEATLPQPKNPAKIAENRAAFIREKYIEKKYVQILDRPNAYLRVAVQNKDVIGILRALASRANTNILIDKDNGDDKAEESIITYSLRTATASCTTFPIVELLLLNTPEQGSVALAATSDAHMSRAAWHYLQTKMGNKSASTNKSISANKPSAPSGNVASSTPHSSPVAPGVPSNSGNTPTKQTTTGKFQKRLSFGK
jgi:Arf-GAP/SH3 domain/ANK repeat/PH domain-containing protein